MLQSSALLVPWGVPRVSERALVPGLDRPGALFGLGAMGLVSGGLVGLFLRRLWTHRRRSGPCPRASRRWRCLVGLWHLPLLGMGLVVAAVRLSIVVVLVVLAATTSRGPLTTCIRWLERVPPTLVAVLGAYVLLVDAHVAYRHHWPHAIASLNPWLMVVFGAFASLLVVFSVLLTATTIAMPEAARRAGMANVETAYWAAIWIGLGTSLLRCTTLAGHVLWEFARDGRPLVVRGTATHKLTTAKTSLALAMIVRGASQAMLLLMVTESPGASTPDLGPVPLSSPSISTVVLGNGAWEALVLTIVLLMAHYVPTMCHERRLHVWAEAQGDESRGWGIHVGIPSVSHAWATAYGAQIAMIFSKHHEGETFQDYSAFSEEGVRENEGTDAGSLSSFAEEPLLSASSAT